MVDLLELKNLSKQFSGVKALDGVSLSLAQGHVHVLCGENGAGKSTLLKVLAGWHPYGSYGGELLLEGRQLRFQNPRQAEDEGIALIAQELALVPELSVAENICLGREPRRGWWVDWASMETRAAQALAQVGLNLHPRALVKDLNIGQQQLVEIAKALSKRARILILDEPTAALTEADAARLLGLVRELAAKGTACFYVSHRMEEVFQVGDWITVLRDGRSVRSAAAGDWTRASVINAMVGRELTQFYPEMERPGQELALELEGLSLRHPEHPEKWALQNISLQVKKGEVFGIAGLMGSGRTALLASLFGAARSPLQGRLCLQGGAWRAAFEAPSQAIQAGLCLVSEDRRRYGLVGGASVKENLSMATLSQSSRNGLLQWQQIEEKASAQVASLGIKTADLELPVFKLSGGNQQKVVLGKWLLAGPKILLLDEPTRGIDVGAKTEIYALIRGLAAKGLSVLVASSDLPELLGISHRILVLSQGRATALLERSAFSPEAVMHAATS